MKQGTQHTLKFMKLKCRLKMQAWQAAGILESIWGVAINSTPAGDIGKFGNQEIAAAIEYHGDADEMIAALVETGWLDEDHQCRLIVHDWSEHAPNHVKGRLAKEGRKFAGVIA